MKRILGLLALISLLLSTGIVIYLLFSPLFALIYTPYLVLSSACTLSFSIAYFYALNNVKNKLLDTVVYLVAFGPTLIPLIAIYDADFMEMYWSNYISLTFLQLGVGVLSASFFFRIPGVNLANICAAISSMILFLFGILIILKLDILGSFTFLISVAAVVSILFLVALFKKIKEI